MSDEYAPNSLTRSFQHPGNADDSPATRNSSDSRLESPDSRLATHDSRLTTRDSRLPVVMAIGGLDPSGGAGILADIKTIAAMRCYGVAALTSLTIQNTVGVFGVYNQTAQAVGEQLQVLFDDFDVSAVKTGMLPSLEIVEEVAGRLRTRNGRVVVIDPVLSSSSGFDLAASALDGIVRELFPLATLVTPNIAEAEAITRIRITDRDSMEAAARKLLDLGPGAILLKGGHLPGAEDAVDLLVDRSGSAEVSGPRISSRNTHGTGCTLASAIASLLARDVDLEGAVRIAKDYVVRAIRSAPGLGKGFGPLNHFEKCLS